MLGSRLWSWDEVNGRFGLQGRGISVGGASGVFQWNQLGDNCDTDAMHVLFCFRGWGAVWREQVVLSLKTEEGNTHASVLLLYQAVISRYGAWDVDDAQPVTVELRELGGSSSSTSGSSTAGGSGSGSSSSPRGGNTIQIRVTDYGNGIPPQQFSHIYDYFYSSNRPSSSL